MSKNDVLDYDSPELARGYYTSSDPQHEGGLFTLDKLGITTGVSKDGVWFLDAGAGPGRLTYEAGLRLGPRSHIIGLDPGEKRIDMAAKFGRKHPNSNVLYLLGVVENLPFADGSFDYVTIISTLHWVPDEYKPKALSEIFRVLKPGGRIGYSGGSGDRDHPHPIQVAMEVLSREPYRNHPPPPQAIPTLLTEDRLKSLLAETGFRCAEFFINPSRLMPEDGAAMVDFLRESASGKIYDHLPAELQLKARSEMEVAFEKHRTKQGIKIEGSMVLGAVATKPLDT